MKTQAHLETLESRALAGGLWATRDDDPFLLPTNPAIALERNAQVWLDDLGVYYGAAGQDPTFDDAHRQWFDSHLHRSTDPAL